ncbi:hypothetical protein RM844_28825 [Streptomyces sp. DSM 44915]|uniref:Helix-turn-helix domain-containing protein n=1 Tax=Streptomyces chisholmiae TaxID=3075540 RepID=A0ABU2JZ56_9ACTN|nr:hypothetical protein [Streptomyces sp. DSM 44915]MDT0270270.1 hypothetical protein [Streptomyces sp. DSM 44915]MDT0270282.1 hypothetical protein [Streptomyces sp. DSM 44915]
MEPLYVPPGHLTAHQVAAQLGIGLPAVRQLVRRGQLRRAGGSPRQPYYAWADVQALIRARRPTAA